MHASSSGGHYVATRPARAERGGAALVGCRGPRDAATARSSSGPRCGGGIGRAHVEAEAEALRPPASAEAGASRERCSECGRHSARGQSAAGESGHVFCKSGPMYLHYQRPLNSIREPVTHVPISDFVVLTGPNGAGKSNLLQAISERAITVDEVPEVFASGQSTIRQFRLSELVTQAEGPQSPAAYRERWVQLSETVRNLVEQLRSPYSGALEGEALEGAVQSALVAQLQISPLALDRFLESTGKKLIELDISDFRKFAPLLIGVRDPFALSITEVFLSYHQRRNSNDRDQWLMTVKGRTDVSPVADEEFVSTYGSPPWDLLNEALKITGLPYEFVPPAGTEDDLPYEPRLTYLPDGNVIRVDALSSGERTLLAVALSLYTGTSLGAITQLPHVLLLDEVDASLHPSMVESLLRVVREVFVNQHNVKVIMTTHSPSTVALAPEESLYVMRRASAPRLKKATRDEALMSLTVGLPTLSVRVENRRQVFVESEYDQGCYQKLFEILRPGLDSAFSLTFMPASKGRGGNSNAVVTLVAELRAAGNDMVWGLVDRDERQDAPEYIVYNARRYSIENLLLDPLGLGVYLMRNHRLASEQIGLVQGLRHFELDQEHAQTLVDYVVARVRAPENDDGRQEGVEYLGGFTANVPAWWLNGQGHQLEDRIKEAFPALRSDDKALKMRVVSDAYRDLPRFIPTEARTVLRQLVS